jgi:membrane protease YdiL (CAAX protease family)
MSLHRHAAPLIEQGWIRALMLLLIYFSLSLLWGYYVWSPELWFFFSFVLSIILVFICRRVVDRKSFESLGFNPAYIYPDVIIGFSLGTFLVCAGALILYFLKDMRWIDVAYKGDTLLFSFGLLAMIAVSEELIFRGYVLRNLMKSFDKWISLVLSAVLFSIVHYSNTGIPMLGLVNTFLGGLLLGICFIITRQLWLPIFFHLSWNFVQGPILGFKVSGLTFESVLSIESSGTSTMTGGEYGFEGSAVCTVLLLCAFVAGCYIESKKSYAPPQENA